MISTDALTALSNAFTSPIDISEVKFVRFNDANSDIHVWDYDQMLGHVHGVVAQRDCTRFNFTKQEFVAFLLANGAKRCGKIPLHF